ncbi:MAG TPA: chemotaxis protein CheB [Kofleriaceae bacterium]|nr:chemotaxis protein CheB [Kofleriaceae bacterium]
MFDVVIIGGSAGALDALVAIVAGIPDTFVPAIVVVLHVSPNGPNLLASVVSRAAPHRNVREADDKEPMVAGGIYLAPPNYHLLIDRDRRIALSVDEHVNYSRPSIDVAFESGVDMLGDRVAGVVLSGANDDGARGLARIAAAGGATLVQDPRSAPYRTMPEAALKAVPSSRAYAIHEIAPALAALSERKFT